MVAYLRVAHPAAWWGGASAADAAKELDALAADRTAWSLFLGDRAAPAFPGMVLAGFWGWRSGKVPLSAAGYLAFEVDELKLTCGKLIASPANYTHRWPEDLANAHWDLEDHTSEGVRALAHAVPFAERLRRVERSTVYVEQIRLLQRGDCPEGYRVKVLARMTELKRREAPVFERVRAECDAAGFSIPG